MLPASYWLLRSLLTYRERAQSGSGGRERTFRRGRANACVHVNSRMMRRLARLVAARPLQRKQQTIVSWTSIAHDRLRKHLWPSL
jgi:hypothetical protein